MVEFGTLCDALYRQTLEEDGLINWSFEEKEVAKNERNIMEKEVAENERNIMMKKGHGVNMILKKGSGNKTFSVIIIAADGDSLSVLMDGRLPIV